MTCTIQSFFQTTNFKKNTFDF